MGKQRARFRASVYPRPDHWSGGPGLAWPILRFGPLLSWEPPDTSDAAGPFRSVVEAILAPDVPISVLPPATCQTFGVRLDPPPPDWQGHPVPRWRGVLCQLGVASIWLRNSRPPTRRPSFASSFFCLRQTQPGRDYTIRCLASSSCASIAGVSSRITPPSGLCLHQQGRGRCPTHWRYAGISNCLDGSH
jgi:hypothetical protein